MSIIRQWIVLVRVKQWVKNLFVFLPIFFGASLLDSAMLMNVIFAFILFCAMASAVYIFNDIIDVTEDRRHPTKKNRPIASGKINPRIAMLVYIILCFGTIIIGFLWSFGIGLAVIFYLGSNIIYSIKLKHIPIVDVFIVASGFIVRLYIGAEAANIQLSEWIVIMTFLLTLFLALSKRRADVLIYKESGKKTRKVIDGYTLDFLNTSMVIMVSVCIVAYIMYTTDQEIILRFNSNYVYLTSVFVLLGLLRYLQIVLDDSLRSPVQIFYTDRIIQSSILLWILSLAMIIYY